MGDNYYREKVIKNGKIIKDTVSNKD